MLIKADMFAAGGGNKLHIFQDIQNSSNEGQLIDLGFAPTFLYVCAIKDTTGYADSYYYYKDENGVETQHYVRIGGSIDDTLPAIYWSADHKQFRFHGAGGTGGVSYNIYAFE